MKYSEAKQTSDMLLLGPVWSYICVCVIWSVSN